MPGYPGIFLCVHGEGLGRVTDTRDMSKAPTVNNLMKYNCHQLKNLWMTALKEQMNVLKEEEGENAVTLPYLKHELELATASTRLPAIRTLPSLRTHPSCCLFLSRCDYEIINN